LGKKKPFALDKFEEFFRLLSGRADSDLRWTVPREEIEAKNYDLKAVNPKAIKKKVSGLPKNSGHHRAKGREVMEALALLRWSTTGQ
jgi:type I restriction enzyme M protein